jgi:hypothetical protein
VVGYCVLAGGNVMVDYVMSALAASVDIVVFLTRDRGRRRVSDLLKVGAGLRNGEFVCSPAVA